MAIGTGFFLSTDPPDAPPNERLVRSSFLSVYVMSIFLDTDRIPYVTFVTIPEGGLFMSWQVRPNLSRALNHAAFPCLHLPGLFGSRIFTASNHLHHSRTPHRSSCAGWSGLFPVPMKFRR
jgi:hypothetical protein